MRLAVIPARGGSKRIPRKNIRLFNGIPIIAWSIRAAIRSRCFDRIVVSTDDPEIADIANRHGAETPFLRPARLSDDYTGTVPVVAHAIDWFQRQGSSVMETCCIYATAPLVVSDDLRKGLNLLRDTAAEFTFSVTSYAFPIQRALRLTGTGRVEMLYPEHFNTRSQDLEEVWHDAGQFYWGTAKAWLSDKPLFGPHSAPVILPRHRVQDIDTPDDWTRAELMSRALHGQGNEG